MGEHISLFWVVKEDLSGVQRLSRTREERGNKLSGKCGESVPYVGKNKCKDLRWSTPGWFEAEHEARSVS